MKKTCLICNIEFTKKINESVKYWLTKSFCSNKCYWVDKKGKIPSHVKLFKKGERVSTLTEFKKGQVSPRKGVKAPQTKEQIKKRTQSLPRGEQHHNWKGGITTENEKIRKSPAYKEWRLSIFRRDFFTCKECGYKGKEIEADHIKPFYLYPELRLDINNGQTLCKTCHRASPTWGRKVYLLKKEIIGQNI